MAACAVENQECLGMVLKEDVYVVQLLVFLINKLYNNTQCNSTNGVKFNYFI